MEFKLLLTNRRKIKWLLLYVLVCVSISSGTAILLSELLKRINAVAGAGLLLVALALFIAFYGLLERIQEAIREPVCITVRPSSIAEATEATGITRSWEMSQLLSYRYEVAGRAGAFLLLQFRDGERVKWQTGDRGLSQHNRKAFAAMANALNAAWEAAKAAG